MSGELEPLSPSEAAKILAGQRWGNDQAHEPGNASERLESESKEGFGVKGVEHGIGYRDI
jgi:hypothetical protein